MCDGKPRKIDSEYLKKISQRHAKMHNLDAAHAITYESAYQDGFIFAMSLAKHFRKDHTPEEFDELIEIMQKQYCELKVGPI